MTTALTLANLTDRTGLDVLDHLERETTIPVVDGLQAQGDLIVIPCAHLDDITIAPNPRWREVPSTGIELLRSAAGGNPHTLVADPGTCQWTTSVDDPTRLALGVLTATVASFFMQEHTDANKEQLQATHEDLCRDRSRYLPDPPPARAPRRHSGGPAHRRLRPAEARDAVRRTAAPYYRLCGLGGLRSSRSTTSTISRQMLFQMSSLFSTTNCTGGLSRCSPA